MNELLINLYCPSTSKYYDFWVPGGLSVESLISQICDDICELENNTEIFADRDKLLLCSYHVGKALPPDMTLEKAGIRSGDRLTLV